MGHYDCPCMEKCPLQHAMLLIGGKWKVQILCAVCNAGSIRYNALRGKLDGVSNTVLSSALKELERLGYLERNQQRESNGRMGRAEYVIYEMPRKKPCSESPCTEKPYTVNPDTDTPVTQNAPMNPEASMRRISGICRSDWMNSGRCRS